jgi:hypothetical protein
MTIFKVKTLRHCLFGIFCGSLLSAAVISQTSVNSAEIVLPEKKPVKLKPYTTIAFSTIKEASGLVKSRLWKGVFWTHNDSGDEPRIFPIRKNGQIIKPTWMKNYGGIRIPDAVNVDWESITTDDKGNLYLGDFGNNSSTRRDLCIYVVEEPYPDQTVVTNTRKKISYYYPEQKQIPHLENNYDAEAMFWKNGKLYILTKHRSDNCTSLYRLDSMDPLVKNPATLVAQFNIQGQVLGADISLDARKLAVLTNNAVWVFEVNNESDDYFNSKVSWFPVKIELGQAICWDGPELIIISEKRRLYKLEENDLIVVRE